MTCVMPPASPDATRVLRTASRSEVLPWSTWPSTATTGGRGTSDPGAAPERSSSGWRLRLDAVAPDGGLGDGVLGLRLEAEVIGGERRGVEVDRLVQGGHDPVAHQVLDQLGTGDAETLGEFGDREPCRQGDFLDRGYVDSSMPSSRIAAARVGSSITSSPTRSERARDRCRRDRRRQVIPVSRQTYAPRPGQRPAGSRVTRPDAPVTARRMSSVRGRTRRQPTQVRSGAAAVTPPQPSSASSPRMSMRQPVSRAASRAFSPPRPIASDS